MFAVPGYGRTSQGLRPTTSTDCPKGMVCLDSQARTRGTTCPSQNDKVVPAFGVIRINFMPTNHASRPGAL